MSPSHPDRVRRNYEGSLHDVFRDPSFAGLHWEIDPDTPIEDRERAHYLAALNARAMRDRKLARTVVILIREPATDACFVQWPNGVREWTRLLRLHAEAWRIVDASC